MSTNWQKNLNKLIGYKVVHGNVDVPITYTDKQLARLVTTLRQQKRSGTLKPERELILFQLGFDFEPMETRWLNMYTKVLDFYLLNGHASPNRRSDSKYERMLADWVHRMHKLIRNNRLSEEKVHKLALINIDGEPSNYHITKNNLPLVFEIMLARLKHYIEHYGHFNHLETDDPELYRWIVLQRNRIDASTISAKEFSSLTRTGLTLEKINCGFPQKISNSR